MSIDVNARGDLTDRAGLSTDPVPLEPYCSEEFFELEKEKVFKRAWLLVAREEEVPEPGCFILKNIYPLDTSIIITRNTKGKIKSFHNTCSHRGGQVVSEPEGRRNLLVCPYHKWSYNSDGELKGVSDERNFFFEKKNCGLAKVAVDVWEGFIFVNMAENPEVSLDEYITPLKDYLSGVKYIAASSPIVVEADLDANWKVVSDAFLETYHIPCIHPKTIAETFSNRANPFARLLDAKQFGTHQQVSMYGNNGYQLDPNNRVEKLAAGDAASVIAAASKKETVDYLAHSAINPTRSPDWSMDANQFFPHVQVDTGPGGFWVHHFWPVSVNTTRYEARFYVSEAQNFSQRFQQEMYVSRIHEVLLEDLVNVKRTQRGINNGGKKFMQLQDSEIAIRHSMERLMKWVNAPTVAEAIK
jgi:phenylpropionate dioxygenase-like ring-hydroxylating dioxygenase large terminal subunit